MLFRSGGKGVGRWVSGECRERRRALSGVLRRSRRQAPCLRPWQLSEITGLTVSQIRQDLNHFGGFGQQGYGYNVNDLKAEIEKIIGINNSYKAIVIGLGNIGKAIFHYKGFQMSGMEVIGLFDRNPEIIGTTVQGLKVRNVNELESFLTKEKADIGILAIPADKAQEVCDILVNSGIGGIWK